MKKDIFKIMVLAFIICFSILLFYQKIKTPVVIAYINDEMIQWDNVEYAEVYVDGCAIPPTFTMDDSAKLKKLVASITDIRKYKIIPAGKQLEGQCDIWIKFSNDVCIGTYKKVNQGYIDLELRTTGGPFYKLPRGFRKEVLDLLEEHEDMLQYRETLKDKINNSQYYTEEEKQAIYTAIDHVEIIKILRDYPTVRIERLGRLPAQYYEEVDENKIDIMDWRVTVGDTGSHNADTKIIDSETYEYLTSLPGA